MKKTRLIKKTELSAPKPASGAEAADNRRHVQRLAGNTQKTVSQWVGAYQNSRCPNPRVAFAALFAAEA